MGALDDLLALFPAGTDQVPNTAVSKALLANPRRTYFRDTRDWLDAQVAELVRLKWVEPATGPRGGKAWRLTIDGQTTRTNALKAAARRETARRKKAADRQAAEVRRVDAEWTALAAGTPGLRIEGETVVVEMRSTDPAALEHLARAVGKAADLIRRRGLVQAGGRRNSPHPA